ncbi:acetyl-CoA carboxylase biotin carboxylase subunit [Pseudohoeflea coraliihabitans]|uniref:Acetyl-CoA carboxylase biotin carboxylase subunit n=1 Tax=Pseudohoeflea coraliihabitans TaxID=2860393 RepID=A0ABS6WKF4_9HYPH|nr:acetyl-CoA carboxylase biotin carboxylase subunit [Pseudohoeflea sp. DP4N28-3]MBW3096429.1 acetyl-CoA carboxylase biotin carboxylase subunit [Pseudohoeflea sp. DP4N28-3]
MKRVLIANRGEIALRAIRACRKAGLESVAVYSQADAASAHVFAADRAICIGPASATTSYLLADLLIEVAKRTGCDAIYPGYGFLSEREGFANACCEAGLVFIGPSAEIIATMGDKAAARRTAQSLGIPVVPGSKEGFTSVAAAAPFADEVGYPLLLKASAGGGGRGMRVVRDKDAFRSMFEQASAEATSAFGNGEIYLERFFENVRHIEVQVFSDRLGNHRHLFERDCSVQRRHQKLVEEAPSPVVSDQIRREMTEAAVTIIEAIKYENAGTIEFIFDVDSQKFFFIEMNTRIQVEHPVTELITGLDLVVEQLRVAAGEKISFAQMTTLPQRAAIEWRVCAEDPARGFAPGPGRISRWRPPVNGHTRVDSHVYEGYAVPPHYDSMIAKVLVSGATRDEVLQRSRHALAAFEVEGIPTTIPFHLDLLHNEAFQSAQIHTRWLDEKGLS